MDPFKNHKQYILEVLPSVLGFLSANKAQKQAEEARKDNKKLKLELMLSELNMIDLNLKALMKVYKTLLKT